MQTVSAPADVRGWEAGCPHGPHGLSDRLNGTLACKRDRCSLGPALPGFARLASGVSASPLTAQRGSVS